jgi:AcrR family transcriptional regulator
MAIEAATGSGPGERPLRRDAERNRRRIMEAARHVFAERGLEVTMDEIARHAGVGVGTVYRRFPEREALIEALFEERVDELVAVAEEALALVNPWDGLVAFLERMCAMQAEDRGLKEILLSHAHGQSRVARSRERLAPIVELLVARAAEHGSLRADLRGPDVALLSLMLGSIADYTCDVAPDAWRRGLGIVLDGLRASRDAPTPLPAEPLSPEQLDRAMGSWRPGAR